MGRATTRKDPRSGTLASGRKVAIVPVARLKAGAVAIDHPTPNADEQAGKLRLLGEDPFGERVRRQQLAPTLAPQRIRTHRAVERRGDCIPIGRSWRAVFDPRCADVQPEVWDGIHRPAEERPRVEVEAAHQRMMRRRPQEGGDQGGDRSSASDARAQVNAQPGSSPNITPSR